MLVLIKRHAPMQSAQTPKAGATITLQGAQDFGFASRRYPQLGHSSELKSFPRMEQRHRQSQRFAL
jgi:hypothetical protein